MADQLARDHILDAAEKRARSAGYHGFSFRDLANDVGIKSSSVHYHFPTKAGLAEALALRYTRRAADRLGDPSTLAPAAALARLAGLFRDALLIDDRMCLCGLFGAERDTLPPPVAEATANFFRMILDFLSCVPGSAFSPDASIAILARFEGALILARTLGDPRLFDRAIASALDAGHR